MVLGAILVAVVGAFVVVPDHDHRVLLVHRLQVRVALVLGVALAVILQGHHFVGRHRVPVGHVAVLADAVFIQVVAQVQHEIQIAVLGQGLVDGKVAVGNIGAGDHREPGPVHVAVRRRQGAGPADGRTLVRHAEPVVIPAPRFQPGGVLFDAEIVLGVGLGLEARHRIQQRRVPGHRDGHRYRARRFLPRGNAGPQHHPVGERITGRHPVGKVHPRNPGLRGRRGLRRFRLIGRRRGRRRRIG